MATTIKERLAQQQEELQKDWEETLTLLLPRCRNSNCGSTDIRTKRSRYFVSPGNGIIGPGGHGATFAERIDFLYCGEKNCGQVYWPEGMEKLEELNAKIQNLQSEIARAQRNFGYW